MFKHHYFGQHPSCSFSMFSQKAVSFKIYTAKKSHGYRKMAQKYRITFQILMFSQVKFPGFLKFCYCIFTSWYAGERLQERDGPHQEEPEGVGELLETQMWTSPRDRWRANKKLETRNERCDLMYTPED